MATFDKHIANDGKITYRVRIRMKGCPLQTASFDRLTDARRWAGSRMPGAGGNRRKRRFRKGVTSRPVKRNATPWRN